MSPDEKEKKPVPEDVLDLFWMEHGEPPDEEEPEPDGLEQFAEYLGF